MVNPIATCLIRDRPHYRCEVFQTALTRLGYTVQARPTRRPPAPEDVLVIWNRYGQGEQQAIAHERVGAAVIVAENGYLPQRDTTKTFALALNHHNGAGSWTGGTPERRGELDVELKPWVSNSSGAGDILLLPQRGIGPAGVAMPRSWQVDVQRRLAAATGRRVRVRPHPGTDRNVRPLALDLEGVHACVTWGSGAALKALIAGVPVFYELSTWIGAPAAQFGVERLEDPIRNDRTFMLERLAWAQWSVEEVATGEPFKRLIELHSTRGK